MISSVVAKLDGSNLIRETIETISKRPEFEVGELLGKRLLPIIIESTDNQAMESSTRWLQTLPSVLFVDVVYVNFEKFDEF